MTTGKEIAGREPVSITPAELVENATMQAKLLMDIVNKTKCYQTISGKKYLQVEAWETIGAFNRTHAITRIIIPIVKDGEIIGYEANVQLIKDGESVGGAIMPCFFTENACKGKEGDAKHKACISAAQTFATSKAYRMNYSYVAILAGYQPTPAEEMTGEAVDDRPANLEHWCEEHKTKFYKRGKMRGYAHPYQEKIGDDEVTRWCNEPVIQPQATTSTSEKSTPVASKPESKGVAPEQADMPAPPEDKVNSEWLAETLKIIRWTERTAKDWIKFQLKAPVEGTLNEVLNLLEEKALQKFIEHIRLMRESAGQ